MLQTETQENHYPDSDPWIGIVDSRLAIIEDRESEDEGAENAEMIVSHSAYVNSSLRKTDHELTSRQTFCNMPSWVGEESKSDSPTTVRHSWLDP